VLSSVIARGEAATSIIVYGEVIEYFLNFPTFSEHKVALNSVLEGVHMHRLTVPILDRYAGIRRQLQRPYGPGTIGDMDAATALERDLTLVTADSDFLRVPGLKVQMMDLRRRS
jgi:predicted nucleic acid-binding protein